MAMKIVRHWATFLFAWVWSSCTLAERGFLNIDGSTRATWYSEPFDHDCLVDCNQQIEQTSYGDISVTNRNCSVQCSGKAIKHRRYRSEKYNRVQLRNPLNGARSECLVGVLAEDVFCATVSILMSGVRKIELDNDGKQCRRTNYRFYLPHQNCDAGPHVEVGEESCREACVHETYIIGQKFTTIDVSQLRAIYSVCYDGMVSESYRLGKRTSDQRFHKLKGRFWHFCRAELTPCTSCFHWGNWTAVTQCTKTCNSPGVQTFYRSCNIMERTGLFGDSVSYSTISNAYCKAYFGGMETKTEQCGSYSACPEWTQWGPWSGCASDVIDATSSNTDATAAMSNRRKAKVDCKSRRKKRDMNGSYQVASKQNLTVLGEHNTTKVNFSNKTVVDLNHEPDSLTHKKVNVVAAFRTRRCWPLRAGVSLCKGNSTQSRKCDAKGKVSSQTTPTMTPDTEMQFDDDCEEENKETSTENTTKTSSATYPMTRDGGTTGSVPRLWLSMATKIGPDLRPKGNRNFTLSDGGFTSVLYDYAPALIAGLLIFIVLLLIALIAVCGTRMMQKNRKSRQDMTTPSFSAGTMGSIPSGLVHGFSHVLGLRHGSGTFGRSGSTINGVGNISDALSSRGSCRSIASNANAKAKPKQQQIPSATVLAGNSIRQNSPHPRIPLTELGCRANPAEANLGNKKPSSSSLLSSSSSACGTPVAPNHCSFQPLPPIPTNPAGNDNSIFKRGTGRSSSLNPTESDRSHQVNTQPRAESMSGRVMDRSYARVSEKHKASSVANARLVFSNNSAGKNSLKGRPGFSSSDAMCSEPSRAGREDEISENEYWSVTRGECFESEADRGGTRHENKAFKRIQEEKERENIRTTRLKSTPSCVKGEEMVDNILYASASVHRSADEEDDLTDDVIPPHDVSVSTKKENRSSDFICEEERFYDTIELEESKNETESAPPVATEDDYDHLCDQFGGPYSTKGRRKYPGTMTSLHYLPHASSYETDDGVRKSHDYESIEFEGNQIEKAPPEDSDKTHRQVRAPNNDYVMTTRGSRENLA